MAGVLSLKTPSTGLVTLTPTDTATDKTITLPATTGTVVIQDGTSTATVVNLTATGTVNVGGGNISPQTGFKNRIINGAMTIDQRNAGAAITSNGGFPVDRLTQNMSGGGVISGHQSTVVPAGFTNSLSQTVNTADSSIAAGDYYYLTHNIEGFNVGDFSWGTANAQTITLSFQVRSSVTGTYAVAFGNSAFNRLYVATYTVNSANTYETKTVTIPGDTSGTWLTNNGIGLRVYFDLGSGSNYNASSSGAWLGSGVGIRTSATINWIANAGATFYITGLQFEKGSTATPFEFRSIGTELGLCQRYYQNVKAGVGVAANTSAINWTAPLLVQMRATPSIGKTATSFSFGDMVSFSYTSSGTPSISAEANNLSLTGLLDGFTTLTAYRFYRHEPSGGDNALFALSAEL